jgi:hypothetical protein
MSAETIPSPLPELSPPPELAVSSPAAETASTAWPPDLALLIDRAARGEISFLAGADGVNVGVVVPLELIVERDRLIEIYEDLADAAAVDAVMAERAAGAQSRPLEELLAELGL